MVRTGKARYRGPVTSRFLIASAIAAPGVLPAPSSGGGVGADRRRFWSALAAVLAITGSLVGCASDSGEATPSAGEVVASSSSEPELDGSTTEPPPPDPSDERDARETALSCLHGTWLVTQADLTQYYAQMSADLGIGLVADGSAELTFDADALQYDYLADYGVALDLEGVDASVSIAGMLGGLFTLDDAGATIRFAASGELLTVGVQVNGIEVPADVVDAQVSEAMASDPFRDGAFLCGDDTLTLRFSTGVSEIPLDLDRK